jgi:hypothetical protein
MHETVAVGVQREEALQAASALLTAIGGPYRPRLFAFVGMSLGLIIAPTSAAMVTLALAMVSPESAVALAWLPRAATIAFAVIGWEAGRDYALRRLHRRFRSQLVERGCPDSVTTSFQLQPDGLVVTSDRFTHLVRWPSLTEVVASPKRWILLADSLAFVVPRAGFATSAQESAFISELLERMTPAARSRSLPAARAVTPRRAQSDDPPPGQPSAAATRAAQRAGLASPAPPAKTTAAAAKGSAKTPSTV